MSGWMLSHSEKRKEGVRMVIETFNFLIAEGHDQNKGGKIWDLYYSALKVHQNTGRGEVKRNPCIEFVNI